MVAPLPDFVQAKTHYPMFVMPLKVFMELADHLPDHQTMLQRGDLVPHDAETMKDLTMFISHQCMYTRSRRKLRAFPNPCTSPKILCAGKATMVCARCGLRRN